MRDCMLVFVWHARSTLQTPLALWGSVEVSHNDSKNRSMVKVTVSKPCNLQCLVSKMICATACLFLFGMRDLRHRHHWPSEAHWRRYKTTWKIGQFWKWQFRNSVIYSTWFQKWYARLHVVFGLACAIYVTDTIGRLSPTGGVTKQQEKSVDG